MAPEHALAAGLAEARKRVRAAGAEPGRVRVVAVTKGFDPFAARAAASMGLADLGESYAGELLSKAGSLRMLTLDQEARPLDIRWHFLGTVQRNKVRRLAPLVHLWHGVTRLVEGMEIARWAPGSAVLVQVAPRPDRRGVTTEEAKALVGDLRDLGLEVRGLMAVGPGGSPEESRPGYRRLAELGGELGLSELSMGMSDDLEVAVQEGATTIRLGRALFGPRPDPAKVQECSLAGGG